MILTPEQIEEAKRRASASWILPVDEDEPAAGVEWAEDHEEQDVIDIFDTLAAYAAVVERVAESYPWSAETCRYCGGPYAEGAIRSVESSESRSLGHVPNCIYLEARRLRGKA